MQSLPNDTAVVVVTSSYDLMTADDKIAAGRKVPLGTDTGDSYDADVHFIDIEPPPPRTEAPTTVTTTTAYEKADKTSTQSTSSTTEACASDEVRRHDCLGHGIGPFSEYCSGYSWCEKTLEAEWEDSFVNPKNWGRRRRSIRRPSMDGRVHYAAALESVRRVT